VLAAALVSTAAAQVAILQIRVIEGDGAVHAPGSRSPRPLTVEITDETGKPVEGAAVSFHLPDDGPGGTFANGLHTVVTATDAAGRASIHGLTLNRTSGRFQIRIVASKEQARAGTVSFQYIAESASGAAKPAGRLRTAGRGRAKWLAVAAAVAGGAVAGILASGGSKGNAPARPGGPPAAAPTVGTPSITVGKP
jgi:hypothetical protein